VDETRTGFVQVDKEKMFPVADGTNGNWAGRGGEWNLAGQRVDSPLTHCFGVC